MARFSRRASRIWSLLQAHSFTLVEIWREAIVPGFGGSGGGALGLAVPGWDLGSCVCLVGRILAPVLVGLRVCHLTTPQRPWEPFRGPQDRVQRSLLLFKQAQTAKGNKTEQNGQGGRERRRRTRGREMAGQQRASEEPWGEDSGSGHFSFYTD